MICCRKNHATPPSIAKNIPKIPMACLCPAKSVTTSYLTALIILSDVLSVNRNRRCHYPTTIVRFLIIQMEYTHDILNSIADFRCRRGDHIIACNSRIMCFGSSAIRGFRSTLSSCNMDSSVVSHSSNPNNMTR